VLKIKAFAVSGQRKNWWIQRRMNKGMMKKKRRKNDGHNTVNNINELRAEGMRDGSDDDDDESKEGHQCSASTCLPVR
jgi:hypothetical protein